MTWSSGKISLIIERFVNTYDRLVKAAYPDGPTSKDYTSIVNDKQYAILLNFFLR